MHSYLGLLWDRDNESATKEAMLLVAQFRAARSNWICRLNSPGCIVFDHSAGRCGLESHVLPDDQGVIVGQLFRKRLQMPASANAKLSADDASGIVESCGRTLIEDYWGAYVTFINRKDTRTKYVIRDCSGALPCFRTQHHEVQLVFADLDDLNALRLPPIGINWPFLERFLSYNDLQTRECALEGITEILAGDCAEVHGGSVEQFALWDPVKICLGGQIASPAEALQELRATAHACIDRWASVHSNILHLLSGGFDSAAVLGCLTRAPRQGKVTCLNRFFAAPGEDEREYARLAAKHAGVELLEHEWTAGCHRLDARILEAPALPKPSIPFIFGMLDLDFRNRTAQAVGADAVWTGQGGDHLFFETSTAVSAGDFLRDRGLGRGFFKAVRDAARVSNASVWNVLHATLLHGWHGQWPAPILSARQTYLAGTAALPLEDIERVLHPWSLAARGLSHGKQMQIFNLGELVNRHRPLAGLEFAGELHPLISQPLMELCLRIPTYHWVHGGRRRGLARDAFAAEVPARILERQHKGGTTAYAVGLIRDSAEFLRWLLIDGMLVQQGMVAPEKLQASLDPRRPMRIEHLFPLLACITAEAWARRLTDLASQRRLELPTFAKLQGHEAADGIGVGGIEVQSIGTGNKGRIGVEQVLRSE